MSAARRRGLAAAALAALAAGGLAFVLLGGDQDGPAPARTTHAHGGPGPVVVDLAPSTAALEDPAATPRPPTEGEAAAVDSDAVLVSGVALLDLDPLVDATLRFTSDADRVEVATGRLGAFEASLPPGEWTVEAPGLPDAEQVVCDMTSFSAPAALARAVAAPPPRLGSRTYPRPTLRVVGSDGAGADATPRRITVRPGGALLLRFEAPWVLEAQVVDALTGVPLPGATATVELQEPYQRRIVGTAGTDGALRLVAPRTYSGAPPAATFEAPGYAAAASLMDARARVRVGLRRPLRLEGRVRDPDGRPVRAGVTAWSRLPDAATGGRSRANRSWRVTCDAEGRFVLDDLPPGGGDAAGEGAGPHAGVVALLIQHPDHARTRLRRVLVVADGPPLEVTLAPLVTQVGRVVDPAGQPLAGAEVRVFEEGPQPEQASGTDAQGRFVLEDVPARSIVLEASRDGFATTRVAVTPPVEALVLRLEEVGPPLRGRVVRAGGEPAAKVLVVATADGGDAPDEPGPAVVRHTALTNDAGAFSIVGVPAGRTFLVRTAWHGGDVLARDVVAGGEPVTLRLLPLHEVVVRVDEVAGAGSAVVTIVDAGGLVVGRVARRARDADDAFLVTVTASGRLGVVVRAPGFAPALRWFDAPPGEFVAVNVPLEPGGGAVALAVRWPQGPAPTLRLAYRDPALGLRLEETFSPPSVVDLPLRLVGVGAGPVRLEVEARRGERVWPLAPLEVVVRAGETTTIDLDLAAALRDDGPR
ncbi:MAG: carboxypeptidase regulatory-like domain-containing protein [Planctomycetes bacterium]|nr:carboxypeptidase regulatory-like domain-containing protein [Planctomycetota bacterium]